MINALANFQPNPLVTSTLRRLFPVTDLGHSIGIDEINKFVLTSCLGGWWLRHLQTWAAKESLKSAIL